MKNRIVLLGAVKLTEGDIVFTYKSIDFPGAVATVAGDVNNSGEIVGGYIASDGSAPIIGQDIVIIAKQ